MATNYRDVVIAPAFVGAHSLGFGTTFYVSNTTNPTEDQGSAGVGTRQGRSPKSPFSTIAAAVTEAVSGRGDMIVVQRGNYTENITFNKAGLVVVAAPGPYGYPDHVTITGICYVTANAVSMRGIEFFSNSANDGSLTVGMTSAGAFSEVNGFSAEGCSFASDGTTEPEYGLRIFGGNNHVLRGNYFIDNTRALSLRSGGTSFISGVTLEGNYFLENTTYDLGTGAPALGSRVAVGDGQGIDGGVRNLVCRYNTFAGGEVLPTTFVTITGTSSGIITKNDIAATTNSSASVVIPAGILYVGNTTEAGVTTARPA